MVRHPISDERIIAFAAGELNDVEVAAVAAHVAGCAACTATAARYRGARSTLRGDASVDPPASVVARAKRLYRPPRPATPADPFATLRRVLARWTFDSRPGLELALGGMRGATPGYRLGFEDETAAVDLLIEPPAVGAADQWRIVGHVDAAPDQPRPTGSQERVAVAVRNAAVTVATDADEHGAFSLLAPTGRYDLLVRLPDHVLVLPDVAIG